MREIKVSVIIPAYNAQNSIERAVKSILSQTMSELEVIVINDGSTDRTKDVLESLKREDRRVIILDKRNEGPLKAREDGIRVSRGEFIHFLDSDDWLENYALEEMYSFAKSKKVDIVVTNFYEDSENGLKLSKAVDSNRVEFTSLEFIHYILQNRAYWALWNKLYKRELFNGIKLPDNLNYGEDLLLSVKVLLNAKRVAVLNKSYLHYINNPNGLSKSRVSIRMYQMFIVYSEIEKALRSEGLESKFQDDLKLSRELLSVSFITQTPYWSEHNYIKGFEYLVSYLKDIRRVDERLELKKRAILELARVLSKNRALLKFFINTIDRVRRFLRGWRR